MEKPQKTQMQSIVTKLMDLSDKANKSDRKLYLGFEKLLKDIESNEISDDELPLEISRVIQNSSELAPVLKRRRSSAVQLQELGTKSKTTSDLKGIYAKEKRSSCIAGESVDEEATISFSYPTTGAHKQKNASKAMGNGPVEFNNIKNIAPDVPTTDLDEEATTSFSHPTTSAHKQKNGSEAMGNGPVRSIFGSNHSIRYKEGASNLDEAAAVSLLPSPDAAQKKSIKGEDDGIWGPIFDAVFTMGDTLSEKDSIYHKIDKALNEALNSHQASNGGKCKSRSIKVASAIISFGALIGVIFIIKASNEVVGKIISPEDATISFPNYTDNRSNYTTDIFNATTEALYSTTANFINATVEAAYNNLTTLEIPGSANTTPASLLNNTTTSSANFTQGASYNTSSP